MSWYVVHTHSGAEARAVWHLRNQGFSVYLPQYLKRRFHAGRTSWARAPLFPRYLFVSLDTMRQRWQAIQSTAGVRYLICGDGKPLPVPDRIIAELREREDEQGLIDMAQQNQFRPGEKVRVDRGALVDQLGVFQCRVDRERVIVLLRLLGRDLQVTLPGVALCKTA